MSVAPLAELHASWGEIISGVRDGGPADRAGLRPGDRLLALDGVVPRDLIDVRFHTLTRERVRVDVTRDGTLFSTSVSAGENDDLGFELAQPTFDGLRECNNNCEFCFIRGLPKGLRRSLYIRDDDYRYSFLFASFVTLTNLEEVDWRRIAYQRLSPLRVSIHATDPDVRARLLKHPGAAPIVPQLRYFEQVGIKVHAQIVLCPGINDGDVLDATLADLAELPDVIESVAVVPVGVSDHLKAREIRPLQPGDATRALKLITRWHRRLRVALGRGFVYPSDELYLMAGRALPGPRFYDGYPQIQNGVGLTRVMLADWRRSRRRLPSSLPSRRRIAWLCGSAARGALAGMATEANRVENLHVDVKVVDNTLFGSAIGVSGLMSGRDAADALRATDYDWAVLPRSAFGFDGQRTLDDWSTDRIAAESGVTIRLGLSAADLVRLTAD